MNINLRKIILTNIFCLIYAVSVAQQGYKKGFIINQKEDTISGFLLFNSIKISTKCLFRQTKESDIIEYNPKDIKGFKFNEGKFFVSKTVILDNESKPRFLEFLIQGKANIYYLRDRSDHYYIETENSKLIELSEKEEIYKSNRLKPTFYKGKLRALMSSAEDIEKDIQNTSLTHKSLIKIGKSYHYKVCDTQECIIFEKKKSKVELKYSVFIGHTFNKLMFGVNVGTDYHKGKNIGLKMELLDVFPWSEKTNLFIGLIGQHYSYYNLSKKGTDHVFVDYNKKTYQVGGRGNSSIIGIENLEVDINTWLIKMHMGISQKILNTGNGPHFSFGITNCLIISQNSDFKLDEFYFEYGKSIPNYSFGLFGTLGSNFIINKKLELFVEANYEYMSNLNINRYLRLNNYQISLNIGVFI